MGALAWVEVLDRRGQVSVRHRIDTAPAIIGRGYGCDVLLDDPWLSPVHLRLYRELDGSLALEDAGSENGTWTPAGRRITSLPLGGGLALKMGRTFVRVVPADAPVAATIGAGIDAPSEGGWRQVWVGPTLALAASMTYAWMRLLDDGEVHHAAALVGDGAAMLLGLTLWAGIWALVTRAVSHRASFLSHLAVASAAALALSGIFYATEYAAFLAPGEPEFPGLVGSIAVGVLAALLFGHLMLATALPSRRAMVISLSVTVALVGLGAVAATDTSTGEDSGTPQFSGELKPLSATFIPTESDSTFFAGFDTLKTTVDSLAADGR